MSKLQAQESSLFSDSSVEAVYQLLAARSAAPDELPLAALLSDTMEAVALVDVRGRIRLFSRGAEKLLGYGAEHMIGKRALGLLTKGAAHQVRQLLGQLDRQGYLHAYEVQVRHSDRSTLALHLAMTRPRFESAPVPGYLIFLKANASSHQAEVQLQRREEELQDFVNVISHNLKTPIISIQGFASLLREELGAQLGNEHLHFLDRIQKNAMLMEKMIADLLQLSRLGHELPKFGWIDLHELVREVIDEMKLLEQIAQKQEAPGLHATNPSAQAPAEFVLPDQLPRLWADASSLKTVFQNLFSNAMKYRRADASLHIEVGEQDLPRFHALWVRDNGMGMDPLFQKKAFNLFRRGPQVGHIPGTGVGLAIVRRIVENHRGLVRVDSKLGEGTTIYFTIPKADTLIVREPTQQGA